MDMTTMHMDVLRDLAEKGLLVARTTVVLELAAAGYIKRNRSQIGQGWQYDVTARGKELLDPLPPATGNTKRLTEAQMWMD